MSAGTPTRWLSSRHSFRVEAISVLVFYALYEATRGLRVADGSIAIRHAQEVVALERRLHVFVESDVQAIARSVPALVGVLGLFYVTLHLTATSGYLIWLHRRRPAAFPFVRTTLVIASGLALVGYLAFPTAPPRLAATGIADTVSTGEIDLNRGLVSVLYNPFAAVPSMHFGYAVIVGTSLARLGVRRVVRLSGALYPALVLFVIVATGNHFFFDAAAGAAVACLAAAAAALLLRPEPRPATRPAMLLMRPVWADGDLSPMRSDAGIVDELVLRLKGLVHMRTLLERSGAPAAEIERRTAEIDRVRADLARLVQESAYDYGSAALSSEHPPPTPCRARCSGSGRER